MDEDELIAETIVDNFTPLLNALKDTDEDSE